MHRSRVEERRPRSVGAVLLGPGVRSGSHGQQRLRAERARAELRGAAVRLSARGGNERLDALASAPDGARTDRDRVLQDQGPALCWMLCRVNRGSRFVHATPITLTLLVRPARPHRVPSSRSLPTRTRRWPSQSDRKSTRLNSSHLGISYAVFCLKKKKRPIGRNYLLR